jgi:hypothetical protein
MTIMQILPLHSKWEVTSVALKNYCNLRSYGPYSDTLHLLSFLPLFSIKSAIFFKAYADPLPYLRHSIIYHINIAAIKN